MRSLLALLVAALTTAVGVTPAAAHPGGDDHRAVTVLPPGNSMTYTVPGQAAGTASGDPDDFGAHVDDQRELYWNWQFKDGGFRDRCAEPQTPQAGVEVCLDEYGVPVIYGETRRNVWFGAGYASAQLRLFLLEATVRTARGTLSELTGPSGVPADVAQRTVGYSDTELSEMYESLSDEARDAIDGYVDGVNAWIGEVVGTDALPAEYVLLQTAPQPITVEDVVATGVLMARFVASEGGTEMANVVALRALEEALGTEQGRAVFQDLVWTGDEQATTTIPAEEAVFPRTALPPSRRQAVFQRWAEYARGIPLELAEGQGTGAHPAPAPAAAPGPAAGEGPAAGVAGPAAAARAALEEWRDQLSGGSFLVAVGPERTADGNALLISEPQLGYSPTLLVELEVHGAGYHARGVSVAGVPTVPIGYGERVAWALTTGNAKTIDSFIETTRADTDADGADEYLHDGVWKNMQCRDEEVAYRAAVEGVPAGPALQGETVQVCRTVHGPVVARTDDGSSARTVQYAMWKREVDTIEGILGWNRASNLEEFEAAMREVTWNENLGYADADGNIAFWHPGLHHERPAETDLRLPLPGTGEWDLGGHLPFEALPHSVNPPRGFLANWNNKPAHGWGDGVGMSATSYPAGRGQRVTNLVELLESRDDLTGEDLAVIDRHAGTHDPRATEFLGHLLALDESGEPSPRERRALQLLAAWDGSANSEGADMRFTEGETATIGAAPTLFNRVLDVLRTDLLHGIDPSVTALAERQHRSGRHVYDMSPALNLVLRILDPSASSLTPSRDYLRGRTPTEALHQALTTALDELEAAQGPDPSAWRSAYRMEPVCSATGVIGPCVEMPFLERGTWIHLVAFTGASGRPAPAEPDARERADAAPGPLPVTGPGTALVLPAVLALLAAAALRRSQTPAPLPSAVSISPASRFDRDG